MAGVDAMTKGTDAHKTVMKYAAPVVREVTYFTPDKRKASGLTGPMSDEDVKKLSRQPTVNGLSLLNEVRFGIEGSTGNGVRLMWLIPALLFTCLTVFGPFSVFSNGGFGAGVWAGMANAGITVTVGGGLYLLEGRLAKKEASEWDEYNRFVAEDASIPFIPSEDVVAIAAKVREIERGMAQLAQLGLDTSDYHTQLRPLVEETLLAAADREQIRRDRKAVERLLADVDEDTINSDEELTRARDEIVRMKRVGEESESQKVSRHRQLTQLGREVNKAAAAAGATLAATRWNAEHGNGRN